jgi:hypothetical protein
MWKKLSSTIKHLYNILFIKKPEGLIHLISQEDDKKKRKAGKGGNARNETLSFQI